MAWVSSIVLFFRCLKKNHCLFICLSLASYLASVVSLEIQVLYNMITLWYLLWKCHCPSEDNTWLLWDAIPLKKHWRIDGGLSANKENGLCLHHLFFRDLFCCRICICVFELAQAFFARIFQSEPGNREESWGVSCCPCRLDLTMWTCSLDRIIDKLY